MTVDPSRTDLFTSDLFLMYNKENMKNMFHETPLGLSESMEQKDYYRARILDLHKELKNKGIKSTTNPLNLDPRKLGPPE